MAYFKETVFYGDYADIKVYHTVHQLNTLPVHRRPAFRETSAAQEEVNRRNSVTSLRRLIVCNFSPGDLHIQLKYIRKKGTPYRSEEEMRKDIAAFHRKMRAQYRKAGLEYKYIHVMEIGIRGARHHHLIVPYIDIRLIQKHWNFARVTFTPLDGGDYKKLAAYLVKQTDELFRQKKLMRQRYNCSKGLIRPIVKKVKITRAATFKRLQKVPKGYILVRDSEVMGVDHYGHVFYRYTLKRIE